MSKPPVEPDDHLAQEVERRRARWGVKGERSFAQNLAMIGALGWLIVAPTVLGLFAGRWLDREFAGGIFWTGALLVAGLALGCNLAWRRMMEQR